MHQSKLASFLKLRVVAIGTSCRCCVVPWWWVITYSAFLMHKAEVAGNDKPVSGWNNRGSNLALLVAVSTPFNPATHGTS